MFTGKLRPFQEEAVQRMVKRRHLLVAYVMGSGKTVLSIAGVEQLYEEERVDAGLVFAGASLKFQWEEMIRDFTDDASIIVIDGSADKRKRQYREAMTGAYRYIILSYGYLLNDWQMVRKLPRDFIIGDEITAIKSFKAKRSQKVKRLGAPYVWGLTGQPVENKPEELFSIMEWIDPDVLGDFAVFDRTFIVRDKRSGVPKRYRNLPLLHKVVATAMVRKSREEIKDQLPQVGEEVHYALLDSRSAKLYRTIARELGQDLAQALNFGMGKFDLFAHYSWRSDDEAANALRGKIMSKITCLRMLCDHPMLLVESARMYDTTHEPGYEGMEAGSAYAAELQNRGLLDTRLPTPKFDDCIDLILSLLEDPGSKVVLFSFFKPTLGLLSARLARAGVGTVQFHGGMTARARNDAKHRFQTDPDVRVFLSSDAGGYGVDLPQANYLINYDLPWSAGKLEQRNSRIIRLSSEFEAVTLINLLVRGSIEERQYQMLKFKNAIASAIVDGRGHDRKGSLAVTLSSLTSFLEESSV